MKKFRLIPLVAMLALVGCSMAPKYEQPEAPVANAWPQGQAYKDVQVTEAPLPAWESFFTDERARQVIQMALENNRDLRVAMLNVDKARAAYGIQRAELFPHAAAGLNAQASRTPRSLSPTGVSSVSHTYQANLASTAWELDLFGRVASLSEAALQTFFATEENALAARNTLIAEVASMWVQIGAQKELLRLQQVTLKSQKESYRLMAESYRLGASSQLELEQAKTTVASAEAALASYQRTLAQARNALSVLVGSAVPVALEPTKLEPATTFGAIAPAALPSEVLLRRPDIRAAENNLKAANANIGAARANFFPRISLTASVGTGSRELSGLFDAGTGLWSFTPGVSIPIFTAGANMAALRQAEAQQKIMVATYEKAIQTAFAEVSDALATEGTMLEQCQALGRLVRATENAYRLSQERYKSGLVGYLTVLESQRQMVSAQTNYISAEQQRLTSGISLYKVLGGGAVQPTEKAS